MSLNQNYNPKEFEKNIYSQWMEAGVGNPDVQVPPNPLEGGANLSLKTPSRGANNVSGVPSHSILMPPPNLTGNMHAGHAFGHYAMDTISRLARQRGEKDLWFPGVDHAGLQLEGVIDKLIRQGEFDSILYHTNSLRDSQSYPPTPLKGEQKYHYKREDLPLNPKLIDRAKEMVKNMTESETMFWNYILKEGENKWIKQRIIDNYILDFFCFELKLAIEIDGISHNSQFAKEYDEQRTFLVENFGIKVLRFTNQEIQEELDKIKIRFNKLIKERKLEMENIIQKVKPLQGVQATPAGYQDIPKEDLPKYLKTKYPGLWLECAWSKVNEWRDNQKNQSAVLGDTPDYSRSLFTLDEQNIEMVNYAFLKYWQDGLIYKGSYLVNWSVGLQTALSDVSGEIDYEKRVDPFVTFEYKLFSGTGVEVDTASPSKEFNPLNNSIQVETVRPETIFGDYAVAIHPEVFEARYSEYKELLENKNLFVQIPLTDKMIPVILADEVDPNFGSGALKITPASDIVDYEIFNKYIGGDFESAIGRDGKLTEICGEFAGQTVNQGRASVIKALIEGGFVPKKNYPPTPLKGEPDKIYIDIDNFEKMPLQGAPQSGGVPDPKKYFGIEFADNINPEEYQIDWNYEHNVTICERTKTVVEPLISEEFFISYHNEFDWKPINKDDNVSIANRGKKTNLQKLGIEAVNKTNFYSEDYKERGINFLENIKDWCISRDLIWGHKMPVWYNLDNNPERKFYSFEEIQAYPPTPFKGGLNENFENKEQNIKPLQGVQATPAGYQNTHFAISPTRPTTPGNWVQEEKILDTWFSSCLWPLSTLKYPEFVNNHKEKINVVLIHGGEVWQDKEVYKNKIESGELNSFWYKSNYNSKKTYKTDLKYFCQENNISFINPQMPNKTHADYTKWKWVFEQSKPFITSETVLVGHSLGSMFLTKYLSENEIDCKAVFLVSGGLWSDSEKNIADFDISWGLDNNYDHLKSLGNKVFIVHSKDDKVVDFQRSLDLKSNLPDANLVEFDGFGHLNVECEELLEIIKSSIKKDKKILILAGRKAKGTNAFYQHVQREFPSAKLLITPFTDQYSDWIDTIDSIKSSLDESTIVITHSMSSLNFCRFMSDNPNIRIKEWHSVGGVFDENLRPDQDEAVTNLVKEFLVTPIDYDIINQNVESIFIHHSKDDSRVVFENTLNYKSKLPKAKLCEYENYGHFVKEGGLEFPELLSLLKKKTDFERFYPTQEMLTAKEIFYQWIVRMTTLSYYFTAEIPYQNLIITPTVLDEKGKKMSKSLGNGLEPVAQIDKYSSDALRMAMLGGMIPNRNMKMGGRLADELCEKYRNFGNKMWNVARFFEYQEEKNIEVK
jgi:valyl-tRNA synthetase/predicted alpha/beta hydrolase family esterase/very-short-patch-repair endonuclease